MRNKFFILIIAAVIILFFYFLLEWGQPYVNNADDLKSSEIEVGDRELTDKKLVYKNKKEVTKSMQLDTAVDDRNSEFNQTLNKMLNTSSDGLVEEKTADGFSVNLNGRFQTVPVATIDDNGEVKIQDFSSKPNQGR